MGITVVKHPLRGLWRPERLHIPSERKGLTGMSNWHSMEVADVLKELGTDQRQGLSGEEVKRRLEKYGYNELKKGG